MAIIPKTPDRQRMEAKIQKTEYCWNWTGARSNLGYGSLSMNGKTMGAHRAYYMIMVGEIPSGLELDHLCRNPSCVRPDHLEPVTHQENMKRSMKFRKPRSKPYKVMPSKICVGCGDVMHKKLHTDYEEWNLRKYCSLTCRRSKPKKLVRHRVGRIPMPQKLSIEQVIEIKKRIADGEHCYIIAKDYPVNKSTIYQIRRGGIWSTVKL